MERFIRDAETKSRHLNIVFVKKDPFRDTLASGFIETALSA